MHEARGAAWETRRLARGRSSPRVGGAALGRLGRAQWQATWSGLKSVARVGHSKSAPKSKSLAAASRWFSRAARDLNAARLNLVAIEAAEQCGRLTVPTVREPVALPKMLAGWDAETPLFVCDERRDGAPPFGTVGAPPGATILVGPEGGFSPEEFEALDALAAARRVSLGANILRAETAALAALAVVACGK